MGDDSTQRARVWGVLYAVACVVAVLYWARVQSTGVGYRGVEVGELSLEGVVVVVSVCVACAGVLVVVDRYV